MPALGLFTRTNDASTPAPSDPPTPGPAVPGGPSPDAAARSIHSPPSPASSLPSKPSPPAEHPRFAEHALAQPVPAAQPATGDPSIIQAPTPPPDAPPVMTTPDGTSKIDAPPRHPALARAGATAPESEPAQPVPIVAPLPVPAPSPEPTIVRPSDPVPDAPAPAKSILRNASLRSKHARGRSGGGGSTPPGGSVRTAGTAGSTFAGGAATSAPYVEPALAEELHVRTASAEEGLTGKDRAKIAKEERKSSSVLAPPLERRCAEAVPRTVKHNRRLSRVIRKEAQAESQALEVAVRELADLQRLQKAAVKDEGATHAAHARALGAEHRAELAAIAARKAHEKARAEMQSAEEALEASRAHAREATEMLRVKAEEVEALRLQKGADDRERAVRVRELVGEDSKRGIGRFFGLQIFVERPVDDFESVA
ncbi:hypothetical protein K488DRAFT_83876 [Vararia minispora EC-137]|uniref:Uncharacterized protein n=1 Tax=Vararia minispora EC-137 TaxID=1314806 RepID=A0ACB8QT87_9AGAM|nr:hypothetical protein K488DRAFT_83876 [Vararia minispora EC-137]